MLTISQDTITTASSLCSLAAMNGGVEEVRFHWLIEQINTGGTRLVSRACCFVPAKPLGKPTCIYIAIRPLLSEKNVTPSRSLLFVNVLRYIVVFWTSDGLSQVYGTLQWCTYLETEFVQFKYVFAAHNVIVENWGDTAICHGPGQIQINPVNSFHVNRAKVRSTLSDLFDVKRAKVCSTLSKSIHWQCFMWVWWNGGGAPSLFQPNPLAPLTRNTSIQCLHRFISLFRHDPPFLAFFAKERCVWLGRQLFEREHVTTLYFSSASLSSC